MNDNSLKYGDISPIQDYRGLALTLQVGQSPISDIIADHIQECDLSTSRMNYLKWHEIGSN